MGCSVPDQSEYQFKARAARRHNQDVLRHLGFHRTTDRDKAALKLWLKGVFQDSQISFDNMVSQAFVWCLHHKVYIPSYKIMAGFVRSVRRVVQSILANSEWVARLTPEDYRGLSPLVYAHINPYGRFDVDLDKRIDFERMAASF